MRPDFKTWPGRAASLAAEKGFEFEPLRAVALMHQELSELLEAHRTGDPTRQCDKPILGLSAEAEECADVFLRLAHYCGARGIDLDAAERRVQLSPFRFHPDYVTWAIVAMHGELVSLTAATRPVWRAEACGALARRLLNYCRTRKINLHDAVESKHAYNATRPFRHGKRF